MTLPTEHQLLATPTALQHRGPHIDTSDPAHRPAELRDRDRIYYSDEFARLEGVTQVANIGVAAHNRMTHSHRVEQAAMSILYTLAYESGHGTCGAEEEFNEPRPEVAQAALIEFADRHQIDIDAIRAASLAHDLGHPPFGHNGERALQEATLCKNCVDEIRTNKSTGQLSADRRLSGEGCITCSNQGQHVEGGPMHPLPDGFEGNAQTLRILSILGRSSHWAEDLPGFGLDPTRVVLEATIKYPWLRRFKSDELMKWGAYDCDLGILKWAFDSGAQPGIVQGEADMGRDLKPPLTRGDPATYAGEAFGRSLNAAIMDWADDVAYSVHDLEDYYRAGAVPLWQLKDYRSESWRAFVEYLRQSPALESNKKLKAFVQEVEDWIAYIPKTPLTSPKPKFPQGKRFASLAEFDARIIGYFPNKRFTGGSHDVQQISYFRSKAMSRLLKGMSIVNNEFAEDDKASVYAQVLKRIVWFYVIDSPQYSAVKAGQRRAVREVYNYFCGLLEQECFAPGEPDVLRLDLLPRQIPIRLRDYVQLADKCAVGFGRYPQTGPGNRYLLRRAVIDFICSLTDSELTVLWDRIQGHSDLSAIRLGFDW